LGIARRGATNKNELGVHAITTTQRFEEIVNQRIPIDD
jgi:hypothetical protein